MLKKISSDIIIALCTSAAIIAFAFDQRHEASRITMSAVAFFVVAGFICLLPVFYAQLRCKTRRSKTPNAG